MNSVLDTPWKLGNEVERWLAYPLARLVFAFYGIPWGKGWRLHGIPIIQKHRQSTIRIGPGLGLRSKMASNPLGVNHPVILCTWQAGAVLQIGDDFAMTGGTLCAAEKISIGNHVNIGANSTVIDTDFHPLQPDLRLERPQDAQTAPIVIEDHVFIGMNCLILKGVRVGTGSVIGAGSIVTRDVPAGVIAAGNPAKVLKKIG